jgi:hypothetical protein
MKRLSTLMAVCVVLVATPRGRSESVSSPVDRQKVLATAEALLANRPTALPAGANDPFHSTPFAEATGAIVHDSAQANDQASRRGHRSDKDLLAAIAVTLKPNGFFILDGESTLIFGQKRVKAGSPMTITFEGAEYTLEIVSVDRTSFTLRYNREEYTRPIK